jgi:hypothetical protein
MRSKSTRHAAGDGGDVAKTLRPEWPTSAGDGGAAASAVPISWSVLHHVVSADPKGMRMGGRWEPTDRPRLGD